MAGLADAMGPFPEGSPPSSLTSLKLPSLPPSLSPSFPPSPVFPCAPSGCGVHSCQFGQRPKAQRGLQRNQVQRRKLPEGHGCCRHSLWLRELLCCGAEGGRVLWGKSHSTLFWPLCTFSLDICSWPAADSVPSWMPTSLVRSGLYYILHFCSSLILFILLIPTLCFPDRKTSSLSHLALALFSS